MLFIFVWFCSSSLLCLAWYFVFLVYVVISYSTVIYSWVCVCVGRGEGGAGGERELVALLFRYFVTFVMYVVVCFLSLLVPLKGYDLSHIMRKPIYAICEQQRRRSACASVQSDQHHCCSLPRQYSICSCYVQNLKALASFCSWAGRFESYLVTNHEDRFSRDVAHLCLWLFLLIFFIVFVL